MKRCEVCDRTIQSGSLCPTCSQPLSITPEEEREIDVNFLHYLEQKELHGRQLSADEIEAKKTISPITDQERAALNERLKARAEFRRKMSDSPIPF